MATKRLRRTRARAAEPSTWGGIAAILLAAGQAFAATGSKTAAVLTGLAAAAGTTAMVMPDKKSDPETEEKQ